ncbi:hypothetical protein [Ruminococcus sp.]|nr:hypothetical protein [Ruminococcus sp.]
MGRLRANDIYSKTTLTHAIYLNDPALWNDYTEDGFEWLDC